ncbi:MAG: ATPase domain-containing protein [Thermoplasmata archaeon]|nr:ATPase domain-containing protein [Thermoplasmata archaeon]
MKRIKTYIHGLDDVLHGGIPDGHIVLLAGEPGTYKSSVAFNIIYNNVKNDKHVACYITLEQGRESLIQQMTGMGMDLESVGNNLSIVDLALIRKNLEKLGQQSWMQIFKTYACNLKENIDYSILVIDSLPVLTMLAEFSNPRIELFHFFEWLREMNITCLLISEMKLGHEDYAEMGEDFLSDGIIHLKMEKVSDVNVQRRIRVVKMRSTEHNSDFFTLLYGKAGFTATRVISE